MANQEKAIHKSVLRTKKTARKYCLIKKLAVLIAVSITKHKHCANENLTSMTESTP